MIPYEAPLQMLPKKLFILNFIFIKSVAIKLALFYCKCLDLSDLPQVKCSQGTCPICYLLCIYSVSKQLHESPRKEES